MGFKGVSVNEQIKIYKKWPIIDIEKKVKEIEYQLSLKPKGELLDLLNFEMKCLKEMTKNSSKY